jgi:hypothetical protein
MNKKVLILVAVLFFCFAILGASAIVAYIYISKAPDRALDTSMTSIQSLKNADIDMNIKYKVSVSSISIDGTIKGNALIDVDNKAADMNMELSLPALGSSASDLKVRVIWAADTLYVLDPTTNKWTSMNQEELKKSGFDPSKTASSDIIIPESLKQNPKYSYIGEETLSGQKVYVYSVQINKDDINKLLEQTLTEAVNKNPTQAQVYKDMKISYDKIEYKYKVWQSNSQPAQIQMTASMTMDMGKTGKAKIDNLEATIDFKSINKGVTITVPAAAQNSKSSFADTRNTQRSSDVRAILNAITQYLADSNHTLANLGNIPTCTAGDSGTFIGTAPGYINLTKLIPDYIVAIPTDPTNGKVTNTGYQICLTASSRVQISAPFAESGKVIAVVR